MGFRDFAKDYKIEYEDRPGRKRPKAIRVYIGPWYKFREPPEKIRFLKWFCLIGMALIALFLLIPMCIDCTFTRIWYIQVPGVAAWIPWIFAACATWRLWTAEEQVDREHNALMGDRMRGASLFLMGFCLISFIGCIYAATMHTAKAADIVVLGCYTLAGMTAIALFSRRKALDMVRVEN